MERAIAYYQQLQQKKGGNPHIGRHLGGLLRQAGFTQITTSASYECYNPLSRITDYLAVRIEESVQDGMEDAQTLQTMCRALYTWSQHPDGLFAQRWCEAIGVKPL